MTLIHTYVDDGNTAHRLISVAYTDSLDRNKHKNSNHNPNITIHFVLKTMHEHLIKVINNKFDLPPPTLLQAYITLLLLLFRFLSHKH